MSAIWIKDHFFLKTFHFNLGGPHFYKFEEKADELKITRSKNNQFIPDFYSAVSNNDRNKSNLQMVSAIVGNNGSGKSTICNIIRDIANTQRDTNQYLEYEEAVIIYEDLNGEASSYRHISREKGIDIYLNQEVKIPLRVTSEFGLIANENGLIQQFTIFYSPFLDNNAHYLDLTPEDLDISLQSTIYKDAERPLLESGNMLAEHYYKNLDRHYALMNFINEKKLDSIGVPVYGNAIVQFHDVHFDLSSPSNISPGFKKVYRRLMTKYESDLQATKTNLHTNATLEDSKVWLLLFFYRDLINTIFKCIDSTNHLLEEAYFDEFPKDMNMSLEELFDFFLKNHSFKESDLNSVPLQQLPVIEIQELITAARSMISGLPEKVHSRDIKFPASFESVSALLKAQRVFLHVMKDISRISGFITAAPGTELSSGEKAMIDLFSRFYDIRDKTIERFRGHPIIGVDTPEEDELKLGRAALLTILLDEGDIGFHPQWKKKYLIKVIKALPVFFDERNIKVQVIFTTHDPLTLSDIPNYNVVYTTKKEERDEPPTYKILDQEEDMEIRPHNTFGANITKMYLDSFFIEGGLVGEFAKEKIDATFQWLNGKDEVTTEDKEYHRKLIGLIGEPLLSKTMSEMYTVRVKDKSLELEVLGARIKELQALESKIKNGKN